MSIQDLPYRSSPFAHLCFLVSEALRGPRLDASRPVVAPAPVAERRGWLDRLDQWAWRAEQERNEAYLAEATDLNDLDARIRELERRIGGRYY